MPKNFFRCTEDATDAISDLFNFVWPTAAALWNLRWQVKGFLAEAVAPTTDQLSHRFIAGSGIQGADLRTACVDHSWEDQQERLAAIVLMNAFAIYEHWADQILETLQQGPDRGQALQRIDGQRIGIIGTINALSNPESAALKAAYYPVLIAEKRYSLPVLGNLVLSYRYFKEIRNCLAHRGGRASDRAENAYLAFAPVSDKVHLGMKGALVHYPMGEGEPVRISLRGVVGFCDILLRMMATIDAELCKSELAEVHFLDRMRRPQSHQPGTLSSRPKTRAQQVSKRCVVCGFPRPKDTKAIYDLLRANHVIGA